MASFVPTAKPALAATGVNQTINFQGRLLNAAGATVPDGFYNIEFKIYQDGDGQSTGDSTGSPAGSLKWTEDYLNVNSQGLKVVNGYLSVQLGSVNAFGSNINWNQSTLWLSMNIGGTSTCGPPFSSCSPDGEMTPMQPFTSAPYALNSGLLGGLSSSQFVQLSQGLQTDASSGTNSIYINKTGTGNLLDLQSGGNDAFVLTNSGDVSFGASANHTISVATAGAGVAGKSLTLSGGSAGTGGSALAGGNLVLQGGAGGGTNGNGGNITIDAGVKNGSGTDGTISIGTGNASAVNISKSGVTTAIGGSLTVASTINGATISGGTLTGTAVNGLNVSSTAIAISAAATNLTVDAGTTGTVSIGGTSTGDILLGGGSGANGCTVNNGNGNLACSGTLNGATISGGTLSGGNISGGTLSAGSFTGGSVSGGTLTATAVNSLNVSGTAVSGTGALTIDASGANTINLGSISTGNILLGGGLGSGGCTVNNGNGNLSCDGTINGATISGGTVSGGTLSAGSFTGGSVSGGTLTATAVNGLNISSTALAVATAATGLTIDAGTTGTVSIGGTSTGDILLGGGSGSTGCTVTNASGNFACAGTLNGATISGGTLSAGSFTGGSVSGGTISGGTLTTSAVNGLNVSSTALAVVAAATNLTIDAGTTGTISLGGTSTGNILLGGGFGSTGCTVNSGNGNLSCDGTINGASISGGTVSGGSVSGGTLTATTVNGLNVSSTALAVSTAATGLTIDAGTTGTISLGATSTGDILLGGGSGSTGCTVTNASGNFACTGTLNGATISGGTLSAGSFTGGSVSGGTLSSGSFSGATVTGGTLTSTAVNGLNVSSTALAVSAAATGLTVDAGTTGTISLGATSTGDILLGGGVGSTGCTVTNASGNLSCAGTLNGATISGGTLSSGSFTGGSVSAGTFSGGTVSGGTLTATAVNGLNVSSTALAVSTAATGLTVDAGTTGTVSIGGTSTGDILLAGGSGSTGCTINNGNGNIVCTGSVNGATLSGGSISGGTVSGGTLTATAVNGLNVSSTAIAVSAAATGLTVDAGTTGTISLGATSTGDILLGGGSGATGCTVTNASGNFACAGTINGATLSGGNISGGTLTSTAVNGLNVSSTALAVSTAATGLTIDAGTTGTVSIGATSTGDILLGGGSGSTGCTVTNASGNFACAGTITGTTLNGTTGINTGAGAGTQRVDSSGNLLNIGNVTTSGASTFSTTGANGFTFRPGTDNSTAFLVQNAGGANTFIGLDTSASALNLGNSAISGAITTISGGTGSTAIQLIQGTGGGIVIGGTGSGSTVSAQCGAGTSTNCGFGNNATDHTTTFGSTTGTSLTTVQSGTGGISLSGNTTVLSGSSFSVSSGATTLTGAGGGNTNAAKINSGTASNTGLAIQGAASQTANLLVLQDSTGASLQTFDKGGNFEQLGYLNTPYGGLGTYGNLLAQSEAFDNAAWAKTSVTAPSANTVVAPDGNTTAESLADSGSGGSASQASSTAPTNANYTFSVWLKTGSGTQAVDLRIDGATSGTGTKATVTATTTWQRFSVTQNPNGFTGNIKVLIFPGGTGGSGTVSGWGAQLVLGSTPQVYTNTVGSAIAANTGLAVNGNAIFQSVANSATAFLFQNASSFNVLGIDTNGNQLKVFDGTATQAYISLSYNDGTSTGTIAASSGTTAIGSGSGAINVIAGSGSAITMTSNATALWRTTAGTLTLQSGTSSDLILTSGSNIVNVSGSSVVKLGQSAGDPGTCTAGAIVYNTSTNTLRGCQGTTPAWNDLINITTPTLQQTYTASAGSTTPEIKLDTTRGALDIQGDNAGAVTTLLNVRAGTASGLGTAIFSVTAAGVTTMQNSAGGALLTADGANSLIQIGSAAAHSTNPTTLILDNYQPTTAGAEPTEVDGAMYYDADNNLFRCGLGGYWQSCAVNNMQNSYDFEDDFLSGGTTNGTIGNMNWGYSQSATNCAAPAYNTLAASHDHPGVLDLGGSSSGAICMIRQGTSNATILAVGDSMKASVQVDSTTSNRMQVGISNWPTTPVTGQEPNSTSSSGVWWEEVAGTANWEYCYGNFNTATCSTGGATTPVVTAGAWVQLEIHVINTGAGTAAVDFMANGVLYQVTAATIDFGTTTAGHQLTPGVSCNVTTAVTRNCYVDYYQWAGEVTTVGGR